METNIKNLPEGNYFTQIMYSDRHAWREVSRTAKTVKVQLVEVDIDPEWKAAREFIPGGFHGHTPNQHQQTWLFKGFGPSLTLRMTKKGWAHKGERFAEGRATEFYDYNF